MFVVCLLIAVSTPVIAGNNLLLNKPSILANVNSIQLNLQKSTDGDPLTFENTSSTNWSYWQGDLQDSYLVQSVVVSLLIAQDELFQQTSIGVSDSDRSTNQGAEFIQCGKWPDGVAGTAVFTCDPPHPVRYVVIKRVSPGFLAVAEVEVPDTTTQSLAELNLMLNKPSTQSSTLYDDAVYAAGQANDGNLLTYSMTKYEESPYWQGDLQGDFLIKSVAVTMTKVYPYLQNAYIGISRQEVGNSEVIQCGQWPNMRLDATLLFRCEYPEAVRYVRIWRDDTYYLALAEVVVHGTPAGPISEMTMSSMESKKVSTVTKTLRTGTSTECANECFRKRPCFAFSFNKMAGQEENCLLSAATTVMSDSNWVSYKMEDTSFCP